MGDIDEKGAQELKEVIWKKFQAKFGETVEKVTPQGHENVREHWDCS